MPKSPQNPKATAYLDAAEKWREEMKQLRTILLGYDLTEELKWGKPCYSYQGKNVVLIIGFKNYCSLLFCKGALLADPKGILVKAGENTQAARQARFTSLEQITKLKSAIKAAVEEAIEAEKSGKEVTYKKQSEFVIPEELQAAFKKSAPLKKAFDALTPGRQRAYIIHFSAPKQTKTREARIEKLTPQILSGKGMNDDYAAAKKPAKA